MELRPNVSLQAYTTFGVPARTAWFVELRTVEEAQELFVNPAKLPRPLLILGGGSNVLFTRDWPGLVVRNRIMGRHIEEENEDMALVEVGAGEDWHELVLFTLAYDLAGLENLSLIPGTVGAAPIQNIGAYGVEQRKYFEKLLALDMETGELEYFDADRCAFAYRDSYFKREGKGKYLILKVWYRLNKQPKPKTDYGALQSTLQAMGVEQPSIRDISKAVIQIRASKLPDPRVIGNAGSFFKNPIIDLAHYQQLKEKHPDLPSYPVAEQDKVKVPAGWLIDRAGWKGKQVGQTGTHKNQALVLINRGTAEGREIYELSETIAQDVRQKYGITLEREVNII